MTSTDTELSRLRWRCRRGTLELDLLFERFLAEAYPSLNPTERSIFDEFLNATDPLIMAWLAGRAKPAQPEFMRIIELLRSGGKHTGDNPDFVTDLSDMSILKIGGKDCVDFLHAQLTSDVSGLAHGTLGMTSWCNPKGRMLMNGYLIRELDHFLLLLDSSLLETISKNLSRFILRSQVDIEVMNNSLTLIGVTCATAAEAESLLGPDLPESARVLSRDGLMFARVRDATARYLILGATAQIQSFRAQLGQNLRPADRDYWRLRDILSGLAWVDMRSSGEFLPLDFNLDALGGLCFSKGCYPGQEIVTRIRHRSHIKKRLFLARVAGGPPPHPGEALVVADEPRHVGVIVAFAPLHADAHAVLAVIECDLVPATTVTTAEGSQSLQYLPPPYDVPTA
jgi:folate-binding protein YgfZ